MVKDFFIRNCKLYVIIGIVLVAFSLTTEPVSAAPGDDFVISIDTTIAPGTSDIEFTIPTHPDEVYNYNVDCDNDGVDDASAVSGNYTCIYTTSGVYTIRIKDNVGDGTGFPRIYFLGSEDSAKLRTIEQWGSGKWTSMENAFNSCVNLLDTPIDNPDLSNVINLSGMFYGADLFNGDISGWDTSNITNMSLMFYNASTFNQDIGSWDTRNVVDMSGMFWYAGAFNQDITGWDTSNVVFFDYMFSNAEAFNQPIGNWNTTSIWEMDGMFLNASAFDQDVGSWNVTSLIEASNMFSGIALSTKNYDSLLIGWASQDLQAGINFDGGNSSYCQGEAARTTMINDDSWSISDGGRDCPITPMIFLPLVISN